MVGRGSTGNVVGTTLAVVMLFGCSTSTPALVVADDSTSSLLIGIPLDVQRLAVLYPKAANGEWSVAYTRLEEAAFRLKVYRPTLKIVDRSNLPTVLSEQRLQNGGSVSDESAVRIGQLLGVDSVLIYRIDGPTLRDRFWARQQRDLPPITVTSKIIRVESAEIVYYNVVTARVEEGKESGWTLSDNVDYQRWSREALDRGITETVFDLQRAFQ
jgi:hypothetical protein